ncbi:MAG TPA: hypothetical protein VFL42_13635, partial [Terriglobales bacterium]|nr:hypothetical protein [Terriglobales bacterium]
MERCRLWLLLISVPLSMAIAGVQETPAAPSQSNQGRAAALAGTGQQHPGTHGRNGSAKQPAKPSSLRGCLKQLGGNWVLAADTGQTITLVGDSSILRPHDGRQIEVQGHLAVDGSFHVVSVSRI